MRRLQNYLTEKLYQRVKQMAGTRRSLSQVIRGLVDWAGPSGDAGSDPFLARALATSKGSGEPYDAADAKRELRRDPQ